MPGEPAGRCVRVRGKVVPEFCLCRVLHKIPARLFSVLNTGHLQKKPMMQSSSPASPCIVLFTPLGGSLEPGLLTPLLSHTLPPPTSALITGLEEGAVCSVLSSRPIIIPLIETDILVLLSKPFPNEEEPG